MNENNNGKKQSFETIDNILNAKALNRTAGLFDNTNRIVKVEDFVTLDLGDGRYSTPDLALQVPFPFKSFATKNVDTSNSDGQALFYMSLNAKNVSSQWVPYFANETKNNIDSWWGSYNIYYPLQTGRKIGINFSTDAAMYSGNSNVSGTVQIAKASAATTSQITIPATTPTLLAVSDPLVDKMYVCNQTGNTIYVSQSASVSSTNGFPVFHNEKFPIDWYGAVYAYGLAGGAVPILRTF